MGRFLYYKHKFKDLYTYSENLLRVDWDGCVEVVSGEAKISYGEEYARIKLEVKEGFEEKALKIIQNRCGESYEFTFTDGFQGHQYIHEIRNGRMVYRSRISNNGRKAKSRVTNIFVVIIEDRMYIYLIG